jgi:hypothetical protein
MKKEVHFFITHESERKTEQILAVKNLNNVVTECNPMKNNELLFSINSDNLYFDEWFSYN